MSTTTSNLGLFKYTEADHNKAFDYKEALNQNWDIIDEVLQEVKNTYVPKTTTINNKALSSNISLTPSDVGALSSHQTIKVNGVTGATTNNYGTCSTAAGTAEKAVALTSGTFNLETGARVLVKFTVTNTAANPTLNVASKGAKAIQYRGSAISAGYLSANRTYEFVYDGSVFQLIGDLDTNSNTTYSAGTDLSLSGTTFNHKASGVTAGTIGTSAATSGSTLAVPYVTYNTQGHITATGTHTHTVSGFLTGHQTIKQDCITGATANRYVACSTAAATAAKTGNVTAGTFALEAGASVKVKFANANTADSPTLNINSKGAKNIFHKGARITTGSNKALLAGVCEFLYDGTQWHLVGNYIDANTTYSAGSGLYLSGTTINHSATITAGTQGTSTASSGSTLTVPYVTYNATGHITAAGTRTHTVTGFLTGHQTIKNQGVTGATINTYAACSTAAGTAAKEASITTGTFNLEAGSIVFVKFANANTAGTPTLNINSKGAKNIFNNGAQITTGDNKALLKGLCEFMYDGTQWHLLGNYIDTNTVYTHPNTVTAGTVGTSTASSGSTLTVPYVTYNANGHITATGTRTHTVTGFQLTSTAVTHAANTAVGSVSQPVYIASNGTATTCTVTEVICVIEQAEDTNSNGRDWYRLWSNGWLEQGGLYYKGSTLAGTDNQIQFLRKSFIDTNYYFLATSAHNTANINTYGLYEKYASRTVSSTVLRVASAIFGYEWMACGWAA